jgi:hypothetical protein
MTPRVEAAFTCRGDSVDRNRALDYAIVISTDSSVAVLRRGKGDVTVLGVAESRLGKQHFSRLTAIWG